MPLPRAFPNPMPPPAGGMPAGSFGSPMAGAAQPVIIPAPPVAGASQLPPVVVVPPASTATQPWLISIADSSLHWELRKPVTSIGSDPSNDIVLAKDADVVAKHAEIRAETSGFVLYDLGSASGAYVDNRRVQGRNLLKDGYRIKLGGTELLFRHLK